MRKLDYYWKKHEEYWHYDDDGNVIFREDTPKDVLDSYKNCVEKYREMILWEIAYNAENMNRDEVDYNADRYCPVYDETIDADLCYDSLMCLNGLFKVSSIKELSDIKDIEYARKKCEACFYSDMSRDC